MSITAQAEAKTISPSMKYSDFKKNLSDIRRLLSPSDRALGANISGKFGKVLRKGESVIWDDINENVVAVFNPKRNILRVRKESPYAHALDIKCDVVLSNTLDEYNAIGSMIAEDVYKKSIIEPQRKLIETAHTSNKPVEIDLGEHTSMRIRVLEDAYYISSGSFRVELAKQYDIQRFKRTPDRKITVTPGASAEN